MSMGLDELAEAENKGGGQDIARTSTKIVMLTSANSM